FTAEPLLRRAINANLRLGATEAVDRVAAFAADASRPEPLRVEAVSALGVWTAPSTMDRVDGIFLGAPAQQRDGAAARAAIERLMAGATAGEAAGSAGMRAALAEAAGRLEVQAAAPQLLAQLKADPAAEVRVASLRALQALKVANMDELMQVALADKDPAVRRAALGILPGLGMSEAAKVQHIAGVVKGASLAEQQGAIQVLGTMNSAPARTLLGTYVSELIAGKTPPELQADVLEAAQASGADKLEAQLEAYQKRRNAPTVADAFSGAMLRGGDARRGVQVVMQNPAAECARCHALNGQGASVGPDLKGVGSRLTREQLVESLLEPSVRIAPGYGTVGITLRNGQRVDGTLREETDTEVVLMVGTPPNERRIPKAEIGQRSNPVSAMPPFGLILKPREIRDLVEFLSTLK
ncbi:MAG: c-type cytochrome, partial [Vicinamibacterales bacterium]